MKKVDSFVWNDTCQKTFDDIKEYLTKPSVSVTPVSEKPFLLRIRTMDHSLGTLLAQKNDEDFEQAINYPNRTLIRAECHYNLVEKECLALSSPSKRHDIT